MEPSQVQAYHDLTVPETPARMAPDQPAQPGVPEYLRIIVHFLTKMNSALDSMTSELRDMRKEMQQLNHKVSAKGSDRAEMMNEEGTSNDSNGRGHHYDGRHSSVQGAIGISASDAE